MVKIQKKNSPESYISCDTMWEICSNMSLLWMVLDLETGECEMGITS